MTSRPVTDEERARAAEFMKSLPCKRKDCGKEFHGIQQYDHKPDLAAYLYRCDRDSCELKWCARVQDGVVQEWLSALA